GEQRDQADHRAYFEGNVQSILVVQHVVVEAIFPVPQLNTIGGEVVHGMSDIDEMLKKLAGNIAIGAVLSRKFQGNSEHVQAVHAHPAGTIRLLDMAPAGQRYVTVKNANIIQSQEAALEDILPSIVLAIDPPGEVEQQLLED